MPLLFAAPAAAALLALLVVPVLALVLSTSPAELRQGAAHPLFWQAFSLSLGTTLASLTLVVVAGTPLAWWLAVSDSRASRIVEPLVSVPIVLPPAVVGIALLQTFGRQGLFGPLLAWLGTDLAFTTAAVVLAQIVVSAPFFVHGAAAAFRRVDQDLLIVARTLGQSPGGAFLRVALPSSLPALVGAGALAWARSLGEFGATLLFAGNLPGRTQTMPLAILMALETDVRAAVALALALAAAALLLLIAVRAAPGIWPSIRGGAAEASQRGSS
jgi:molybdate transport system permease protein